MELIKSILKYTLLLVVLMLVIAYLLPSQVTVTRSREIQRPPQVLFDQVNNLHNWEKWSPWHQIDPHMKIVYNDIESGKNASYSWNSTNKKVGNGKITITDSFVPDSIKISLDFMENGTAKTVYYFTPVKGGTKLTMSMTSYSGYNPVARWMSLFFDRWIGSDFEKALTNLEKATTNLKITP